jgi:hypothetical protein
MLSATQNQLFNTRQVGATGGTPATYDAEGNQTRKEYQELDTFYTIPYSNNWIDNEDADRLKGNSLFDIFKDWCGEQYFTYEMKPNFSDYGDVDSKALNQDLKSDLERYLNK